jgi:hypothetical protein
MKKLLFILTLFLSINMFSQRAELWGELSTLTALSKEEMLQTLKSTCVGSSYDYITFTADDKIVEISYENNQAERIVIKNFTEVEGLKELLTEGNMFNPIRGYFYYRVFIQGNVITLIKK